MLGAAWLAKQVVARYPAPEYAPLFWVHLSRLKPIDYNPPSIYYSGFILAATVVLAVVIGLLWDRRRWPVAAAIYFGIFLTLFTTIFTNGAGIASGWVGSLGYWLEQHEVQRGGQPWFYYLVIIPLYDFLPLLGSLGAILFLVVRGVIRAVRRTQSPDGSAVPFISFLVFWGLSSWLAYSYAGEKMPWLSVHIVLPMVFLTAYLVGRLFGAVDWQAVGQRYGWLLSSPPGDGAPSRGIP
jgi:predicted membrane-bound mannosyltransferase